MKMNITITQKNVGLFETDKEIVNIDVCNGNWKYMDDMMETDEKIPLTINTVNKSYYLDLPVKDVYAFHDEKLYNETGEIQTKDVSVRTYESLLSFLNHRLNNVKEDYKKGTYKLLDYDKKGGRVFTAVLFEQKRGQDSNVINDIIYVKKAMIEVKIAVIE